MTNSGDAAEQVVRLSLEGFEVAARLTGSAAKNIAILLASVLKQEATQANKTRGKARLTNMIKSGNFRCEQHRQIYQTNHTRFIPPFQPLSSPQQPFFRYYGNTRKLKV